MPMFREWHDFVTYPLEPERVKTAQERLDTAGKVRVGDEDYRVEDGGVVTEPLLIRDGDVVEAMRVHDSGGGVTIWTKKWVFFLLRDRGLEKSFFVPRHPEPGT